MDIIGSADNFDGDEDDSVGIIGPVEIPLGDNGSVVAIDIVYSSETPLEADCKVGIVGPSATPFGDEDSTFGVVGPLERPLGANGSMVGSTPK